MPNWCDNELIIAGKDLDSCIDAVKGDKAIFDFNKIIPMPEALVGTTSGGSVRYGLMILGLCDPLEIKGYPWVQEAGANDAEAIKVLLKERFPEAEEVARKSIAAKKETGFKDWYDWAIANWGTKWNASHPEILEHNEKKVRFGFDTAWRPPVPVALALSRKFPKHTITLKYWEGASGVKGMMKCKAGEIIGESSASYSGPRGG